MTDADETSLPTPDPNCAAAVLARGEGGRAIERPPNQSSDWKALMNQALDARMAAGCQRLTDAAVGRLLGHHAPQPPQPPPRAAQGKQTNDAAI